MTHLLFERNLRRRNISGRKENPDPIQVVKIAAVV
jgi:hypothetical protein